MDQVAFGHRIFQIRKQMGLSQLDFASLCEMQAGYIAQLELGKRNPTLASINKIALGVGMSTSELMAEEAPALKEQDELTNKILIQVAPLRPETKARILEMIKIFVKDQ